LGKKQCVHIIFLAFGIEICYNKIVFCNYVVLEMSKTKFFPGLKEGCQAQKAAAWSSGARKEGTAENCTEKTLLSKN